MEKIVELKNKYIIYNENKKILTFNIEMGNGINKIFVPSVIEESSLDSFKESITNIIASLYTSCDLFYLGEKTNTSIIFKTHNRKLEKVALEKTKKYFSCYNEFQKNFCNEIMKLCYKEGIICELFSIDELKHMIEYYSDDKLQIDKDLIQPLDELQKRLKFIKY